MSVGPLAGAMNEYPTRRLAELSWMVPVPFAPANGIPPIDKPVCRLSAIRYNAHLMTTDPPRIPHLSAEEREAFLRFVRQMRKEDKLSDPQAAEDLLRHWRLFHQHSD